MLRSMNEILGYSIEAVDGEIGTVNDVYIDENNWHIRYLVVDTGHWLPGKKVVIAPSGFRGKPDWLSKKFPVILTCEMVKNWHNAESVKPISSEVEASFFSYYAWPVTPGIYPDNMVPEMIYESMNFVTEESAKSNLRSVKEVKGYTVNAQDEACGHVDDFIFDDEAFEVNYIAVDTRNWLPGKHVIVPISEIIKIRWTERAVMFDLPKEEIQAKYPYDPDEPINITDKGTKYDYKGQPRP